MPKQFRLHAHEVWREKLVRSGVYQEEGNLSEFVLDEWEDGHFVWCCYSASRGENEVFGLLMFRPENGLVDENFFVAGKLGLGHDEEFLCRPAEFTFDEQRTALKEMECALSDLAWGRVFYLDEELELRCENALMPCEWGVFIASNGLGLWKWTARNGVTWGKASVEGIFRWAEDSAETVQFLARNTSEQVWERLRRQLEDENSEMAFSQRWLQLEFDEERLDAVVLWEHGSREECEVVLRWLVLSLLETQRTRVMMLDFPLYENGRQTRISLSVDGYLIELSARLKMALDTVKTYFGCHLKSGLPMCVQSSPIENALYVVIEEPTGHERLEARLQLRQWCEERGLVL